MSKQLPKANAGDIRDDNNDNNNDDNDEEQEAPRQGRRVAAHVREWQRAVADREAARLARPEKRQVVKLKHADKKKSAVTSTPFGINPIRRYGDSDEEEEWCGPFSVARQIIAKREASKRKREAEAEEKEGKELHPLDQHMIEVEEADERKAHPSLLWKSRIETTASAPASMYTKRQKRMDAVKERQSRIPTLAQLCMNFVVEHFEYVESLGDVPNEVRVDISRELVSHSKLNATAFNAIIEPTMETLELIDCSGIPEDVMAKAIATFVDLRYLLLTHAGRCFGPETVNSLINKSQARLVCLSISGAYILHDEDAAKLIQASSETLSSLDFSTCPLLGDKLVNSIIDNCTNGELLEMAFQDMPITAEALKKLSTQPKAASPIRNVKSLKLQSVPGMSDEVILSFLEACGDILDTLNISYNLGLTDNSLSAIRQCNPHLRNLNIEGLRMLTSPGLEVLFTRDIEGITTPPPKLKVLKAAACDHELITDNVVRSLVEGGSSRGTALQASTSKLPSSFSGGSGVGLVQLDIQGATLVTDSTLEQLAQHCGSSLEDLNVSYCPKLTNKGMGYLVDKCSNQLSKIHTWGCAQLTDEFFDGHSRVVDYTHSFEIFGAWMKKSGRRSVR